MWYPDTGPVRSPCWLSAPARRPCQAERAGPHVVGHFLNAETLRSGSSTHRSPLHHPAFLAAARRVRGLHREIVDVDIPFESAGVGLASYGREPRAHVFPQNHLQAGGFDLLAVVVGLLEEAQLRSIRPRKREVR